MGAVDLGELALERGARRVLGQRERPSAGSRSAIDQLGLEPVDPAHEAAQQGVRPPAEVVVLERELVDPLDQHRQPVARR